MNLIYDHGGLLPALDWSFLIILPVALDDSVTVPEDAGLTNVVVLENDTDVDNDTLTLSAVSIDDPTMGTVAVNADGTTIDFTPAADVNGPVSVTYTTTDGNGGTDQGTLAINITPVADAPEPVGDHFEVDKNSGTVSLDVMANDTDVDGDTLSLVTATTNQGGTVSVVDGQLAYQPADGFNGLETITYTDGERDSIQRRRLW